MPSECLLLNSTMYDVDPSMWTTLRLNANNPFLLLFKKKPRILEIFFFLSRY